MVDIINFVESLWYIIKTASALYRLSEEEKRKFRDPKIIHQFMGNKEANPIILNVGGDCYIGSYNNIPKEEVKNIAAVFNNVTDEKEKRDIKIIDSGFHERYRKQEDIKTEDKKITLLIKHLDIETRNILELAMKVKSFYENEPQEAFALKSDIGGQYGKFGRKLCNLYTQGYITQLVDYLLMVSNDDFDAVAKKINEEINKFTRDSDYIFFIHQGHAAEIITTKVRIGIKNHVEFIAVHSAGVNNGKCSEILEKVKEEAEAGGYTIDQKNLVNKQGVPIFSFFLTFKKN